MLSGIKNRTVRYIIDWVVWRYLSWRLCEERNHPKSSHYWVDDWGRGKEAGKSYCQHNGGCGCGYNCGR